MRMLFSLCYTLKKTDNAEDVNVMNYFTFPNGKWTLPNAKQITRTDIQKHYAVITSSAKVK